MRLASLVLAVVVVIAVQAAGEEEKPSDPSCSVEGTLEACLIVTDEGNELLTKWAGGEPRLTITNIDTAKRGEFITVIVRFLGCQDLGYPILHCFLHFLLGLNDIRVFLRIHH